MDAFLKDLRYSMRRLARTPGFTVIVLLTLALGIGANTAIFSVVNGVLLRALPYPESDRLVTVEHFYPSLNNLRAPVSVPGFRDYRARTRLFQRAAVETGWAPNLTGHGDPERLTGTEATADYFATLGAQALRGRTFTPDEDQPGRPSVVVLSYGLWQRLFGGAPTAVGQTLILNGEAHEIVGVMPAGFRDFFNRRAELWRPLHFRPEQYADNQRTSEYLSFLGRLTPGMTLGAARADMTAYAAQLRQGYPNSYARDWTLTVTPLQEQAVGGIRTALLVLFGAVGFVLLIACANVANLLLARAASRIKEVAIRSALGAGKRHIVRQLLSESLLLSLGGAVGGLALAAGAVRLVHALNPTNLPRVENIQLDSNVLWFTLLTALVTGALFGLAPIVQTLRTNLQDTLKEGGRSAHADRGGDRLRRVLVVAEFALALTLLTGAGLLIRSFARVSGVDPGFEPRHLLTFNIALPQAKYPRDTQQLALFDAMLPRIASLPGVQGAGATSVLPFGGSWSTGSFNVEGYQRPANAPMPWGDLRNVTPGFFTTMRIPLRAGRVFTEQDKAGAPAVAVVDEEFVHRFFPKADPVGKRITFNDLGDTAIKWINIVGVVGHTKHEGLDAQARIQVYFSNAQSSGRFRSIVVRTAGEPMAVLGAVRETVHSLDPDLAISQAAPMEQLVEQSVGQRRFSTLLLGMFATIALVLATIGIYGVMSYSVAQRSHELGVRMALGAKRSLVLRLVMQRGLMAALPGVVIGVVGAFAVTRVLQNQLFGVSATDPLTFGAVAALLTLVALAASLVPAIRATRVDPVVALREE
jgi:putative ABC transport system permease protein